MLALNSVPNKTLKPNALLPLTPTEGINTPNPHLFQETLPGKEQIDASPQIKDSLPTLEEVPASLKETLLATDERGDVLAAVKLAISDLTAQGPFGSNPETYDH